MCYYYLHKHRVLLPPENKNHRQSGQSIVCFVHPDADCVVTCVDGCKFAIHYEPVRADDYIERRLYDTFGK